MGVHMQALRFHKWSCKVQVTTYSMSLFLATRRRAFPGLCFLNSTLPLWNRKVTTCIRAATTSLEEAGTLSSRLPLKPLDLPKSPSTTTAPGNVMRLSTKLRLLRFLCWLFECLVSAHTTSRFSLPNERPVLDWNDVTKP